MINRERLQEVNREKFLEACDKGRSEVVESVLNEEVTQDDRTALANTKSMVSLNLIHCALIQQTGVTMHAFCM